MGLDILFDNLGVVLVVALVLWLVLRVRRSSRAPEARARTAEVAAEREDALTSIAAGWRLSDPEGERYGLATEGLKAYCIVASGPNGRRLAAIALSEAAAYQTAVKAINGDHPETAAWAPPIDPVSTQRDIRPKAGDVELPSGWMLQGVDREDYRTEDGTLTTYGAMAVGPGGERALVVTRERNDAIARLVDRLEGRLDTTTSWVFRLDDTSPTP